MNSTRSRSRRIRSGRRRVWLAVGATVLGGSLATAAVAFTPDDSGDTTQARPASLDTIALVGSSSSERALPRTDTKAFSLIGVSWKNPTKGFDGTAQIRTRSAGTGEWTDWRDLDFDTVAPETAEGSAPGIRGASEPLWVGPSNAVEARVIANGKQTTTVPDGLRLDLIDPGTAPNGKAKGKNNGNGNGNGQGNGQSKSNGQGNGNGQSKSNGQGNGNGQSKGNGQGGTKPGDSAGGPSATAEQPSSPSTSSAAGDTPPDTAPSSTPTHDAGNGGQDDAPSTTPEATADDGSNTPEPTGPADNTTEEPADSSSTTPDAEPTAGSETPGSADSDSPTVPADSAQPEPTESAPEPSDAASEPSAPSASETPTPTKPAAPAIVDRATWGADESLVEDPPEYLDKVKAVFVHHTAGTNDYSCADSPAIIRAILLYHVRTEGWNDVGYNFFVDKCGTVFEGRAGGVDKRVRGAHTYGFNGDSAGISLLGDYENGGTPTAAAKQAIADLAAWKLGLDGVNPQAQVTLTAAGDTGVYKTGQKATLNTISGHRDGFATLCPGKTLYSALPGIRTAAGQSRYATH
ncbi:N-acetylmuramoyl-L-alanine amidase [Streptomyces sp. NPDC056309]|uniref:N-acetylmuramoyl-L-alanine amidase n=1 Tax=unclassified Streptomyces TaxID=2593676 RepID=UPI0035DA1A04